MDSRCISGCAPYYIRLHGGYTLQNALDLIRRPSAHFSKYYVNVFPGVIPNPADLEMATNQFFELTDSFRKRIPYHHSTLVPAPGVPGFYVNGGSAAVSTTSSLELQGHFTEVPDNVSLASPLDVAQFLTSFIPDIAASCTNRTIPHVYGRNFEHFRNASIPSYLVDVPDTIAVKNGYPRMVGINVPTYYLGGTGSFSDFHIEDGLLDSVNLMHWGLGSAAKIWLIISPDSTRDFCNLVTQKAHCLRDRELAKESGDRDPRYTTWGLKCEFPLNHKNIVVTPAFLDQHNILYYTIIQRAGDLVYLRPGVYHSVFNVGTSLAEAVNVGGPLWNEVMKTTLHSNSFCDCPSRCVAPVDPNFLQTGNIVHTSNSFQQCPVRSCPYIAPTTANLRYHQRIHQPCKSTSRPFTCSRCFLCYTSESSLANHQLKTCQYTCASCNVTILCRHRSQHNRTCGKNSCSPREKVSCPFCNKALSRDHLTRHKKICSKRPSPSSGR